MKHEKRHRQVISSEAIGLEVHKQTCQCLLATQEVQIPFRYFTLENKPWYK